MPGAEFPEPELAFNDPRGALRLFLRAFRHVVDEAVQYVGDDRAVFGPDREELDPLLRGAWEEAERDFDRLIGRVERIPDEALDLHGLRGGQLAFKLASTRAAYRRLPVPTRISRSFRNLMRWLLEMLNAVFESILKAMNTHSAVEEIKKVLLHWLGAPDLQEG
jgi:hypothetical protein